MVHLLREAGRVLSPSWVKKFVTIYADDIHMCAIFHGQVELHAALRSF